MKGPGCLGLLAISVLSTLYKAWALTILWGWFIVPYVGLRALSLPLAAGFCYTAWLIVPYNSNVAEKQYGSEAEKWFTLSAMRFLIPTIALAFGWFFSLFL